MRKRVLPMLILSIGCLVAASGGALHWLYESQVDQIRSIHQRQARIAAHSPSTTNSSAGTVAPSSDADLTSEISITQAHSRRAFWLMLSASIAVGAALAAFLYELTGAAEQALDQRARELEQANETTARRDEALRTCSTELSGAVSAIEQRDQALRARSAELAEAQTELGNARTRLHDTKIALTELRSAMEQRDQQARALSQKNDALAQELANARATLEQRVAECTAELADDAARHESAAEALRISEACFRAMFESSTVGMCESDRATGRFRRVNRKLCEITGYSEAELLERTFLDITHPDDREANREQHRRFHTGEQQEYLVEKRYLRKDGGVVWVQVGVSPRAQEATRVFAVVQDITERKRAETALAKSERFARSIVDALGEHLAILDSNGRILATNRAWSEFTSANGGDNRECGVGANYLAVCDAAAIMDGNEEARAVAAGLRAVISAQASDFATEYSCHAPDQQRWFEMRVVRFGDEGAARILVSHQDVTERRLAAHELRFQKALYEAQSEASNDGILLVSGQGKILSYNPRFVEMWRIPQEVIETRSDEAALRAVNEMLLDPEQFRARVMYLYEHPEEKSQDEVQLKDGRIFDRYTVSIAGPDGAIMGRVWYFHDITERHRARELERERTGLKEAVTDMEQVLGVVGHELRTPLAGLRAMSEFLLTDAARGTAEYEQFLGGMSDEVARMSDTVDNLLEAARLNSGKARWNFRVFALRDICEDAIDTIRPLIDPAKIVTELNVDPPNLSMRGDAEAVRRLIINLANNARKHTEAGQITLRASALSDSAGDWVEFILSDTGCGIAPEIQSRLGEPFALNSGVVGSYSVSGAGLGLAICKGIVAAHGGSLTIDSTLGAGTRIIVRLRADLAQAQSQSVTSQAADLLPAEKIGSQENHHVDDPGCG